MVFNLNIVIKKKKYNSHYLNNVTVNSFKSWRQRCLGTDHTEMVNYIY